MSNGKCIAWVPGVRPCGLSEDEHGRKRGQTRHGFRPAPTDPTPTHDQPDPTALRGLSEAATPGEWRAFIDDYEAGTMFLTADADDPAATHYIGGISADDAVFIAAAVNFVRAALAQPAAVGVVERCGRHPDGCVKATMEALDVDADDARWLRESGVIVCLTDPGIVACAPTPPAPAASAVLDGEVVEGVRPDQGFGCNSYRCAIGRGSSSEKHREDARHFAAAYALAAARKEGPRE